mgnify:CR=1 FL=1
MLEKMIPIIAEQLNVNESEIKAESNFKDDLGADSLDLFELVMALEEEFGVSAAAVAVAAPAAGGAAAADEKTEFDVVLANAGGSKMGVIKVVKEITGLGLKEAKALVDECPKPIKEGASKAEAEEIKAKLEEYLETRRGWRYCRTQVS